MLLTKDFKEIPYWLDPPPLTRSFANIPLPANTDVLVIGSGYTGTTAAIRLKQAGIDVTLIDTMKLGTAASARNGGMTLTGLSQSLTWIERKLGKEKARRLFAESLESVNTVEQIVAEGKIDCDFKRYGHLEAAFKPAHFEELKHGQDRLYHQYNHETQIINAADLKAEIDSALYHGALLDPVSAGVQPAKYIAGLVDMAENLGVKLCEEVTAEAAVRSGAGFSIRTSRGSITATEVIVATNGYTGPLTPWLRNRTVSTESMMIATEELPVKTARSLIPKGRMIFDTKKFLFYFRLSPDGKRLLFGGRPKSPAKTLRENADYMYRNLLTVYPGLYGTNIEYAWSGKLGFTMARLPHIGTHRGLHYALGYCGHGVALATYLGEKLAAMVQGKNPDTAFIDLPFKQVPFYRGKLWYRPLLYALFGMKDKVA